MTSPVATLWTSASTSGTLAHMAVAYAGLPVDVRFISLRGGEHQTPDYLAINPKGEVPALQLPSGGTVTELPAILTWVADMAPASGLLPPAHPQRAIALSWLAWCHLQMGRSFSVAFQPERLVDGDAAAAAVLRAASIKRALAALEFADRHVAPDATLMGNGRITAPDLFLALLASFAGYLKLDISGLAALNALMAKVFGEPAIAAALAKEQAAG